MRLEGARVLLLTGGGSGIGRELALGLADRGCSLVLVGRRATALGETAALARERGGRADTLVADLADPDQPPEIVDAAVDALGGLDILISNAGNVSAGPLETMPVADIITMVGVNVIAPILLTRAALPHLRAAGALGGARAGVVGVSSGIALVGLPYYAAYAATKAGLARFDEALRRELLGTGVTVTTVYPGATDTPMMASSDAGEDLGFGRRPVTEVAEEILAGLEADEAEINTAAPHRRGMQELNSRDPLAVDVALQPRLSALATAVTRHRSM